MRSLRWSAGTLLLTVLCACDASPSFAEGLDDEQVSVTTAALDTLTRSKTERPLASFGEDLRAFLIWTPIQFGPDVSQAARGMMNDLSSAPSRFAQTWTQARPIQRAGWGTALLLGMLALLATLRVHLRLWRSASPLAPLCTGDRRTFAVLRRLARRLAVPFSAWLLAAGPTRAITADAPWSLLLTSVMAQVLLLAVVLALLCEGSARLAEWVDRTDLEPLFRTAWWSTALIFLFSIPSYALETIGYREDVVVLLATAGWLAALVATVRLAGLRACLLRLLPSDGGPDYHTLRKAIEDQLPTFLATVFLILLLGLLGFRHAAAVILWRGALLVTLFTVVTLIWRWMEALTHREARSPLEASLQREWNRFSRAVLILLATLLALRVSGASPMIRALLDIPLLSFRDLSLSLLRTAEAALALILAVALARALRLVLEDIVLPRAGWDSGANYALATAAKYATLALGGVVAVLLLGFDYSSMALFAGALGVGIGLGLQDITRNLVAGVVLLFGRSVERGDVITVGDDQFGRVAEVSARSVTVLTPDHSELVIPSSDLINSTIINWTHSDPLVRLHIPVGLHYKTDPKAAREALLEAARREPRILEDPEPDVWLVDFGDNSIDFELLAWMDAATHSRRDVAGKLRFTLHEVLTERGIEIPYPQRDIHVKSVPWKSDAPTEPAR